MLFLPYWPTEQDENDSSADETEDESLNDPAPDTPKDISGCSMGDLLNAMPDEVLGEIFTWCTPSDKQQDDNPPRFSLSLSHVCRHWRHVATSTPRIWTYTKLNIYQGNLQPTIELLKLWLTHSRTCPIFIDIDFVDVFSYYRPVLDQFERIVLVTRQHRPAWYIADAFLATHLEATSTESRPSREEWYFWCARPHIEDRRNAENKAVVTIRALRLAVGSFVLEPYRSWFSSLTYLVIKDFNNFTDLTVHNAAMILAAFPLLVHCTLHIDYTEFAGSAETKLDYLKSLSLSWANWVDISPLIDCLKASALTELEFSGHLPAIGRQRWTSLQNFLHRSRPPLTHLILEKIDCIYIDLLDCLDLCPRLEGLWLEECILDDNLLRGLYTPSRSPTETAKGVLTTANTLVLLYCHWFSVDTLASVLRNVNNTSGRRRVRVYTSDLRERISEEQLQELEALGLQSLEDGPETWPSEHEESRTTSTSWDFDL